MTGYNWTGDDIVYTHLPEEYGAIHFHEDDIDDSRWDADFEWTIPEETEERRLRSPSQIGDDDDPVNEDYIPVFVSPKRGTSNADLAVIIPTGSYLAYANDNLATNSVVAQLLAGKVSEMQIQDLYLNEHREYGLSTYSLHADGHGVAISSRLRPLLNMRPKYRHWLSPSLWQLNGDLHLTDWLEVKGIDFDLWTDEDLDREGVDLLARYKVVLTGSHPEYSSENMVTAYENYQHAGGRWLYLGADGFYWIIVFHPDNPNIIEVRKGEAGTRAWTANPGEYNNAFDGKFGGMWRARGRIPSKVCGLTFTGYGFDVSSYYRRAPDSLRPECAWMFEGIGEDEVIGDFGLVGGARRASSSTATTSSSGRPTTRTCLPARKGTRISCSSQRGDSLHRPRLLRRRGREPDDPGGHDLLQDAERRRRLGAGLPRLVRESLLEQLRRTTFPVSPRTSFAVS